MQAVPLTPAMIQAPRILSNADLYASTYSWISQFCTPQIEQENIIRAWQNRAHPPAFTNDMIVMTLVSTARRGSNVEKTEDDGSMRSSELIVCRMQIDSYSQNPEIARVRAQALEHAARSSIGIRRFAKMGIGCNFANDARDMTFVDTSSQFLARWTLEIQLSYALAMEYQERTFTDDPSLKYFENVDAHHPLDRSLDTPSSDDLESDDAPNE